MYTELEVDLGIALWWVCSYMPLSGSGGGLSLTEVGGGVDLDPECHPPDLDMTKPRSILEAKL